MQAAALSGKAMAEWIAASRGRRPADVADLPLGLTTPLKPAAGEEIGQFPASGSSSQGGYPMQQQVQQPRRQQQQQQQQQQQPQPVVAARVGAADKQRSTDAATSPQLLSRPVRRAS